MTAFRSREEVLLARNHELEQALAAARARVVAAEHGLEVVRSFEAVTDVHVGLARGLLWATVVGYAIGAVISFPGYIAIATTDAPDLPFEGIPPVVVGVGMALLVSGAFLPVGVAALVGAIGLRRGKRWGFTAAVIAFGSLALCCTPIGAYGLWAFLRGPVRRVFYPPTAPGQAPWGTAPGASWGSGAAPGHPPPGGGGAPGWHPPGGGGPAS